jgi:hypothetical protein
LHVAWETKTCHISSGGSVPATLAEQVAERMPKVAITLSYRIRSTENTTRSCQQRCETPHTVSCKRRHGFGANALRTMALHTRSARQEGSFHRLFLPAHEDKLTMRYRMRQRRDVPNTFILAIDQKAQHRSRLASSRGSAGKFSRPFKHNLTDSRGCIPALPIAMQSHLQESFVCVLHNFLTKKQV